MEINKIEDILVPTKPIGANGWDQEILPVILGYADYVGDNLVSPASQAEIENAEKRLGATLPEDLRLFYLRFGNASLMETLLPVADFYYLSASWPESLLGRYTGEEREALSKLIVFGEFLGNGNVWCFHKDDKKIFYFVHDSRPNINGMFNTFAEYLKPLLIYSQGMVLGEGVEGIEEATEKMVIGLIGKDRVRVWQYFPGWG